MRRRLTYREPDLRCASALGIFRPRNRSSQSSQRYACKRNNWRKALSTRPFRREGRTLRLPQRGQDFCRRTKRRPPNVDYTRRNRERARRASGLADACVLGRNILETGHGHLAGTGLFTCRHALRPELRREAGAPFARSPGQLDEFRPVCSPRDRSPGHRPERSDSPPARSAFVPRNL